MSDSQIRRNVEQLLKEIPEGVQITAAAKTRTSEQIQQAVDAGIKIIGENYVQEAVRAARAVKGEIKWHFIGHLQKNKVNKSAHYPLR